MPVAITKDSHPGIYIEELPASSFTISPAPTSVTVFIGYTHPFRTRATNFGAVVRIFSPAEYEREFGGPFASGVFDSNTTHAIEQFFLNGGSDAYVVGLKPKYLLSGGTVSPLEPIEFEADPASLPTDPTTAMNPGVIIAKSAGTGPGFVFFALEPTDQIAMTVTIAPKPTTFDAADVSITYGTTAEVFRGLTTTTFVGQINAESKLVRVRPAGAGAPADLDFDGTGKPVSMELPPTTPSNLTTTFDPKQFTDSFKDDGELDKVDVFNLMTIPGITDPGVWAGAQTFCERKLAFLIMDPPSGGSADVLLQKLDATVQSLPKSQNAALYFPYLITTHPITGDQLDLPPSGFVAGIYARTDVAFGVWKAPAGLDALVRNASGVVPAGRLTDKRQGVLNGKAVNCLRDFPGIGTVVFGARTTVAENPTFQQWKYVSVRRMALFIQQTLRANLPWVVFRPNDEPLWAAIRATVSDFMRSLFNQGALQGRSPAEAYRVKCDSETTTPDDINNGIVNIVVAFAPLKPAEFVVIKIAQLAGQSPT